MAKITLIPKEVEVVERVLEEEKYILELSRDELGFLKALCGASGVLQADHIGIDPKIPSRLYNELVKYIQGYRYAFTVTNSPCYNKY